MTRRTSRKLRSNRRRPAITSKASKPKKLKMKWPAAIDYDTRVALGLPVHGKKSRRTSRKPVRKNSRRRTSLRRNGDVRITGKQYASYYAMKRGGPSANDGYNIQQYGMTYEQFRAIKRLEENIGGGGYTMTLAEANALLAGKKVQMARASQSEIDALAKAFERKIRKNSRHRTSRGLRRNYTSDAEKLAKLLQAEYEGVKYDPKTESGHTRDSGYGSITFQESGNDPAVWVNMPARSFKTDAATAFENIKKIKEIYWSM